MAKSRRKKKRVLNARFVWMILLVISAIFFVVIYNMPMIPSKWKMLCLLALGAMLAVTLLLSTLFFRSAFVKFIELLLCVVMATASVLLPHYTSRISEIIDTATGTTTKISLYVMSEDYRSEHTDVFSTTEVSENLSDYASSVFITAIAVDSTNQNYVLEQLQSDLGAAVSTIDRTSVVEAAASLYNNEGDVMILSDTMRNMITETEGYENFLSETTVIATYYKEVETEVVTSDATLTETPFCIFFGGNDEEGDLYLEGRTDVDMVVTVNPNTHQIAIVSFPRDSYIANPAYGDGYYDKLTHLGLSGIQNTLDGLNDLLGLDDVIDNYVVVNFTTFRNIIDAVGGVDVENDVSFTAVDGQYYPEGTIHLEGEYALMYVRERYAFTDGDFERNYHQQLVMKAIIEKVASAEVIMYFDELLDALEGTFMTNLSSDSIYALCQKQLDENISWNIVTYHITGSYDYGYCAAAGQTLSVVDPYDNQVEYVSSVIQDVLNGNIVTQEELPDGENYSSISSSSSSSSSSGSYSGSYYNSDDGNNGYGRGGN